MGRLSNEPIPDSHVPETEGLQIGGHILSISCGVVERPDHHCGYDLVNVFFKEQDIERKSCLAERTEEQIFLVQ